MERSKWYMAVALGAVVGCVGSSLAGLVVPPASAQQKAALSRWEYRCFGEQDAPDLQEQLQKLGQENWELGSAASTYGGSAVWCVKRPKL